LGLYRFLHLGFQEFLAARYLAEVVSREEGLGGVVRLLEDGLVTDSWWREPILLLVGYLSSSSPEAATRLLQRLAGLTRLAAERQLPPESRWAAAELAASAAQEWAGVAAETRRELAVYLAGLFAGTAAINEVSPARRASAGAALAGLGDPRRELVDVAAMEFCLAPAGEFWMGDGEEMHRQSCLDYDYWLARYPVSYGQYAQFMAAGGYENPAYWPEAKARGYWKNGQMKGLWYGDRGNKPGLPGAPNQPARAISWYEALAFARWLDAQWRGRLPAGLRVRLPTEAEWEKGARGGLRLLAEPVIWSPGQAGKATGKRTLLDNPQPKRAFPWGDTADERRANCKESGIGDVSSLGCFLGGGSPYGMNEMAGNVWEWTRTLYAGYPYAPDAERENLNASSSTGRVLRGGPHYESRTNVRCGARDWDLPDVGYWYVGFRLALSPFDSGL
jgi:formylglycine-generating enzyme required for sulfatase activity